MDKMYILYNYKIVGELRGFYLTGEGDKEDAPYLLSKELETPEYYVAEMTIEKNLLNKVGHPEEMGGLTRCILDIVLTDDDKTVKDCFRGCYFYTDRGRAGLKDNIAGTFTKEKGEDSSVLTTPYVVFRDVYFKALISNEYTGIEGIHRDGF